MGEEMVKFPYRFWAEVCLAMSFDNQQSGKWQLASNQCGFLVIYALVLARL